MVKCLNKFQKKYVKYFYHTEHRTITAIAEGMGVSRRTIKRVLDEVVTDE